MYLLSKFLIFRVFNEMSRSVERDLLHAIIITAFGRLINELQLAWIAHWRNNHFLMYIIFVSLQCCASYLMFILCYTTENLMTRVSLFQIHDKLCIQTVHLCYSTSIVNVAQKFNPNNLKFLKSVVYIRRMPLLRFQKMSITVTFKQGWFIFLWRLK